MFVLVAAIAGALCLILIVRLLVVVLWEYPATAELASSSRPLNICVVLGSGGHTSEMLATLRTLPEGAWGRHRPFYVISATDKDSEGVATKFEEQTCRRCARCFRIPRAREVGQSYLTSVFSTLLALSVAFRVVWRENPEVILTNGPGVCVPVVAAAILISAVTMCNRPSIGYFESFTCVDHLSLSGTLLLPIADVFTVQWRALEIALKKKAPRRVWFTGPEKQQSTPPLSVSDKKPVAVVTVGSTKFDELMAEVDHIEFFEALHTMGIRECVIQKGRSEYLFSSFVLSDDTNPPRPTVVAGVEVTVVNYKPFLQQDIQNAALVISHAGAGTILEAMSSKTRMIVVPNERLMSNHQVQLAQALHDGHYLFLVYVHKLVSSLRSLEFDRLETFPPTNSASITEAFRRVTRRGD